MKWILAGVLLIVGTGLVMWKLGTKSSPPVVALPTFDAGEVIEPSDARPYKRSVATAEISDAGTASTQAGDEQLDPKGEAFSDRLDINIPNTLRSKLASCERDGVDPDAKIAISYSLHIEGGLISTSNVRVTRSTLEDSALEQCMITAVSAARWEDKQMPDFEEETELFLRIRSLNKYLSPEEQAKAKERDQILE